MNFSFWVLGAVVLAMFIAYGAHLSFAFRFMAYARIAGMATSLAVHEYIGLAHFARTRNLLSGR